MLSARRIGSAWPLARTRIAWSRGAAPASIRRPISAAIQSASSAPEANTSSRTGAGAGETRCGPQPLDDPGTDLEAVRVVEPDEPVGRVEDRGERPVVAAQHDGPAAGIAVAEGEDVVDRRSPERVDRLVVVAHHGHVAMALGESSDELGLGAVRVLELVDKDVPEATGDRGPGRRRCPDEAQGERDLVAEIDAAVGGQQPLVRGVGTAPARAGGAASSAAASAGVGAGLDRLGASRGLGQARRLDRQTIGVGKVVGRRDVLVLAAAEQRRERGQETGRVAERPVGVEVELEEVLAQEDHDLGPGQDAQVGRQPELQRVVPDEAVAEGMERRDRRVRVAVRHELVDADRHLLGRLVGERQGQDLRRLRTPRRDEPGDPPGDDLGLAGAGAGDHQQRARAVGDRPELVGIEPAQERFEAGRRRIVGRRRHDRHELAPGRELIEWRRFAARSRPRAGSPGSAGVGIAVVGAMTGASPAAVTSSLSRPSPAGSRRLSSSDKRGIRLARP